MNRADGFSGTGSRRAGAAGTPRAALGLGVAGLIPFMALGGIVAFGPAEFQAAARDALLIYAIAILSFMGGVHWGLAMNRPPAAGNGSDWRRYGLSVIPALAAWATLAVPRAQQFLWLGGAFVLLLLYDLRSVRRGEAPAWYAPLRIGLTLIVAICLVLASSV